MAEQQPHDRTDLKWATASRTQLPHNPNMLPEFQCMNGSDNAFRDALRKAIPGAMTTPEGPALRETALKEKEKKDREAAAKWEALFEKKIPDKGNVFTAPDTSELEK
jgi:hypothetical protein